MRKNIFSFIRYTVLSAGLFALVCCTADEKKTATSHHRSDGELVKANGKSPLMLLTDRAPNLETPLYYFLLDYTPNDVFFVRWHLSGLPEKIDADTFRLRIGGNVQKSLVLSLNDLKTKFKPFTITALCECAGNSRSFFSPRVPGAQWKNGAMGNAKWTGVKLKDLLEMAGPDAGAMDISFNGLDYPPLNTIADFEKSLSLSHCLDGEVMIAYEMNGESIPVLNGFPLKLVVPGWYATYWVGMLCSITVHDEKYHGYWMDKAYVAPKNVSNGNEKPDTLAKDLTPISKLDVRSIFVTPEPDSTLQAGQQYEIAGVAMDCGNGIRKVEVSTDSGRTWTLARLDQDLGKYSWRHWRYTWKPTVTGAYKLKVRATGNTGETQPEHQWNRSGYLRNEIETLNVKVE